MSYEVELDVFEGPFDLLLQLISRREVDITEVDLAAITADFLASLPDIDAVDLETATHFLVVAATLIEIKAARLLPADQQDELEDLVGDARDVLYARLLEYRAFRDAAELLGHRAELHRGFVARDVPLEPRFQRLVPDTPLTVAPEDLAHLAARATASAADEEIDLGHIRRSYISIREAAGRVLDRIAEAGTTATFESMVAELGRSDRIVMFLSLLELYKIGELELHQEDWDAELTVRRRDTGPRDVDVSVLIDDYGGGDPAADEDGRDQPAAAGVDGDGTG